MQAGGRRRRGPRSRGSRSPARRRRRAARRASSASDAEQRRALRHAAAHRAAGRSSLPVDRRDLLAVAADRERDVLDEAAQQVAARRAVDVQERESGRRAPAGWNGFMSPQVEDARARGGRRAAAPSSPTRAIAASARACAAASAAAVRCRSSSQRYAPPVSPRVRSRAPSGPATTWQLVQRLAAGIDASARSVTICTGRRRAEDGAGLRRPRARRRRGARSPCRRRRRTPACLGNARSPPRPPPSRVPTRVAAAQSGGRIARRDVERAEDLVATSRAPSRRRASTRTRSSCSATRAPGEAGSVIQSFSMSSVATRRRVVVLPEPEVAREREDVRRRVPGDGVERARRRSASCSLHALHRRRARRGSARRRAPRRRGRGRRSPRAGSSRSRRACVRSAAARRRARARAARERAPRTRPGRGRSRARAACSGRRRCGRRSGSCAAASTRPSDDRTTTQRPEPVPASSVTSAVHAAAQPAAS